MVILGFNLNNDRDLVLNTKRFTPLNALHIPYPMIVQPSSVTIETGINQTKETATKMVSYQFAMLLMPEKPTASEYFNATTMA